MSVNSANMVLATSKRLRHFMFFTLYLGQGTLVGFFFFVMPSWQAVNGATTAEVGFVLSAAGLPWALKIAYGFLIDRFSVPDMGRRRPWLIGAQLVIMVTLLSMALIGPAAGDLAVLAAFAFAINMAVGFQDVATDGLAVDFVPDSERGVVNGFMVGGQALGAALSIGANGLLAAKFGIAMAAVCLAVITLIVATLSIAVRERQGHRLLPWSVSTDPTLITGAPPLAFSELLRTVIGQLRHRGNLMLLTAALFMGTTGGLFRGATPLYAADTLGWSGEEFTALAGQTALASGLLSLLVFGVLTQFAGAKRMMVISFIVVTVMAILPIAFPTFLETASAFRAFYFIFTAVKMLGAIAWAAMAMRLCNTGVAATQFAFYMAAASLGLAVGPALLAPLQSMAGFPAMFAAMSIFSLIGAVLVRNSGVIGGDNQPR